MDFIDDFIKEYKSSPCLWKADCSDFKNRTKRQEAYMKLIDVATKHGEHYNVERTKQKINNLRCAFRHQLKKYNELKKKGEKYEPYCPKRRYFESLMFLKDEEISDKRTKRESKPAQDTNFSENAVLCTQNQVCEDYSDSDILQKQKQTEGDKMSAEFCTNIFEETVTTESLLSIPKRPNVSIKEVELMIPSDHIHSSEGKPMSISNNIIELPNMGKEQMETQMYEFEKEAITQQKPSKINARKRSYSTSSQVSTETENVAGGKPLKVDISTIDFEKLLSLAFKNANNNIEDHFTNVGKIIAHKLRSMDPMQSIYAEKIIADVLYQGQMKMLSALNITHQLQNIENSQVYAENHNK